jgi:glutamate 5-kinase
LKQLAKDYKRIVIKIGSSLLYTEDTKLDHSFLSEITDQISSLVNSGKEIIIVSSGAIAMGMSILKLGSRPKELSGLQASAAIGQHELMHVYRKLFQTRQLNCAQLLLTWEDFNDRGRYLNAKNTLLKLLKFKSIPIINENDTVSTDEIKFGDNDKLSALVSNLISADLLIILSDVDGLLDKNKTVVKIVNEITPEIRELVCQTNKKICVGGMIAKLEAAKIATGSGLPCVIANGRRKDIIYSILDDPAQSGTIFLSKNMLNAKKRWIAFGARPKGKIIVDDGAKNALLNNKSLLSVGVLDSIGDFASLDTVSVLDSKRSEFARGKVGISSKQLEKIKGMRYSKEVIHRDNIVILL